MTKYRLNIPEMIKREHAHFVLPLIETKTVELSQEDYDKNLLCPKSWLEELKEDSAFEKWFDKNKYEVDIVEKTWQASQENRDLLYKDLIEIVVRYGVTTRHILNEVDKIKKTLQGND